MRLCHGCKIALLCMSSETVFDRAKIMIWRRVLNTSNNRFIYILLYFFVIGREAYQTFEGNLMELLCKPLEGNFFLCSPFFGSILVIDLWFSCPVLNRYTRCLQKTERHSF